MKLAVLAICAAFALTLAACGDDDAEVPARGGGDADVQARMLVDHTGGSEWRAVTEARPGDELTFRIELFNGGAEQARDMVVSNRLPAGLRLVDQGPMLYEIGVDVANGHPVPDGLFDDGLELGPLGSHDGVFLEFEARVTRADADRRLVNRATVASHSGETSTSATVMVQRQ